MTSENHRPVGEVLNDLRIEPFTEGEVPIAGFFLVKTREADGDQSWTFRTTEEMNLEELYGAMQIQVELLRRSLLEAWDVD